MKWNEYTSKCSDAVDAINMSRELMAEGEPGRAINCLLAARDALSEMINARLIVMPAKKKP